MTDFLNLVDGDLELVATMDWAYRNRYWRAAPARQRARRSSPRTVRRFQLRLECSPIPTRRATGSTLDTPLDSGRQGHPNRAIPVSSSSASRVPIYGAALLRTSLCQEHIEGAVPQEACPVCAYDKRNHATHDVAGRSRTKTAAPAEAVRS